MRDRRTRRWILFLDQAGLLALMLQLNSGLDPQVTATTKKIEAEISSDIWEPRETMGTETGHSAPKRREEWPIREQVNPRCSTFHRSEGSRQLDRISCPSKAIVCSNPGS